MKKFAIGFGLLFFFGLFVQAKTDSPSAQVERQIQKFYSTYLSNLEKNHSAKSNQASQKKILEKYLTPDFVARFQKSIEENGSDPVLLAQDWGDDYKEKIQVSEIQIESGKKASAIVKLGEVGPSEKSPGSRTLKIKLLKLGSVWKIDSVSP